jgi:hypothetical protein
MKKTLLILALSIPISLMAQLKDDWATGDTLTAARLQAITDSVQDARTSIAALPTIVMTTDSLIIFVSDGDTLMAYTEIARRESISSVAPVFTDTVAFYAFGLGSGLAKDTAVFVDNAIIGAYYNAGSDTLHVTSLMCVLAEGSGTETVGVQISWHATFKSGSATNLNASAYTVTSITTGNNDTSFANAIIPPGVWVWGTISATSTGNKPSLLSVTLSGYKKPTY